MGRTSEGGSVLGFVVVAVVLATLLIGGVYVAGRQDTTQSAPPATKPQEPKKEEKQTPPPPAEPGNKPDQSQAVPQAGVSHELPMTGPTESLGSFLILGLVSGLFVGYIRSRRIHLSL